MELQYHSTTRDPVSWASLRFPSRGPNDTTQGYREWQGQRILGYPAHMEDPTLRRTTAGLAGSNSPFSESEESRSSRFKHIIIPKPNRAYAQYTGQDSLHRGTTYWDQAQRSLSRQNENGFTPSPSFATQDLSKFREASYENELSLNNSYKHSRKPMDNEPFPPRKKYKGSADSAGRNGENSVSAFKAFKRNDNNHQFSRIQERNKNLPPPPPLVKAGEKMNKNSKPEMKSREEVIVIRDSPPPQARPEKCQSESRKDPLRASKLETISRETLHHSKPISSTRVHSMEHRSPMGVSKNYNSRDARESMELMHSCHCHHHDNISYLSKGSPQFANLDNRICGAKATPFVTTQHATRSHYEPHTGIQYGHPDYHNGILYSPTKKTSESYKNNRSKSHKVVGSSSSSRNAPSRNFCDTHEALHAWRMKSQLAELPPDSRINNTFVADVLKNNSKNMPPKLLDSRFPHKRDAAAFREATHVGAFEDPRQFKEHRSQTPVVKAKVARSQVSRAEYPAIQKKLEYPCQQNEELHLFINQKMSQLSKTDQAKLSKYLEVYGRANKLRHHQFMVTQQPSRVSEIFHSHDIQKLPVSQAHDAQSLSNTQKSKYEQKQETLLSLLMSSNSQEKGTSVLTNTATGKVVMSSGFADSALMSPRKGHVSSQLPVYSSPDKGYSTSSVGNMVSRGKPAMMSQVNFSSSLPNGDRLSNSNGGNTSKDNNTLVMPSKSNASRSPPSLDSHRKSLKETENHKANSSQPISRTSTSSADAQKVPLVQKNPVALFQSPPQSRRLSYPLENNGFKEKSSRENSSATLQRSKSEGDQKTQCETDVSPLLKNFKEDEETTVQPCGGYAFDHDSLPIIVAVHSIVVKKDSPKRIESSQEEKTKEEIPIAMKDSANTGTSSHSVVDLISTSKDTSTSNQRPILPKPDTTIEKTNVSEEMQVSGVQSVRDQVASKNTSTRNQRHILPKPDTMIDQTKVSEEMHVSGVQSVRDQVASSSSPTSSSLSSSLSTSSLLTSLLSSSGSPSSSSSSLPSSSPLSLSSSSSSLTSSLSTSSLLTSLLSSSVSPSSSSSSLPSSSPLSLSSSSLTSSLSTSSLLTSLLSLSVSPSSSSSSLPSSSPALTSLTSSPLLPPPPPSSPSAAAAAAEVGQPVNSVCTISSIASHCNDDKQIRSQAPNSASEDNSTSNDLILGHDTSNTTSSNSATSVSSEINMNGSSHLPSKSDEEVESKGKTSKLIVHRRQSVEELSNKVVETRERIDKEEIDWKKKLLRRLEYVLIKKLKKAEKETGEKATIDLTPAEKNTKGKEEQKKAKNCKRTKSCSDDTSSKVEQQEKEAKEKCEDTTQKSSDKNNEANNANKQKKKYRPKYITELGDIVVEEESKSTSTPISIKKSVDSVTMRQEEIVHADVSEDSLTNNNEILTPSVNDRTTFEECTENLFSPLSPAVEYEGFLDFGCSDLVIAE